MHWVKWNKLIELSEAKRPFFLEGNARELSSNVSPHLFFSSVYDRLIFLLIFHFLFNFGEQNIFQINFKCQVIMKKQ